MEARFLSKVDKNGDNGCWVWTGGKLRGGYGNFSTEGKCYQAHRVSYELFVGKIPDGLCVLHSCDNPPCVNPAHLSVGTHQQNMREMAERGRAREMQGMKHPLARLTDDDVREIRILLGFGFTGVEIGKKFNIGDGMISHIKHGRSWTHVV